MSADATQFKREAAEKACEFLESGMVVGLGHGSTAVWAIRRIAELLKSGALRDIVGIPCSLAVEAESRRLGIPLTSLAQHPNIDMTIDGADEVDPDLNLIKGGGGALLREKIVGQATQRYIIVVDQTKRTPALGTRWAVPLEVLAFGLARQVTFLESLGAEVSERMLDTKTPFRTDQGNAVLDCTFGPISDPHTLAATLNARAGILEHGLFLDMATDVVSAGPDGTEHATRG
jgi:ribose 5-phosphate isomerase A